MKEYSLEYLSCVKCQKKLELEKLEEKKEITEGFLICSNCNLSFPIVCQVPILWDDFTAYLSSRASLGGQLLNDAKSPKMKEFVQKSLSKITKNVEDQTKIEKRWLRIYQNNKDAKFYSKIKNLLKQIPRSDLVLEHGCSIGMISEHLAKKHGMVFGIDSSFYSIRMAKKLKRKNLDFFVADSLYPPFGNQKFGLVVALNLLEIIEPEHLLDVISKQTSGMVLLSSPYDYERGQNSVRNPLDETALRKQLKSLGFQIIKKTKKPSYIPWKLKLNKRAILEYKVDMVLAKRK